MSKIIRNVLVLSLLPLVLQGCISNADKEIKANTTNNNVTSSKEIKDQAFIQKLADLKRRSPVSDAQQAIANGDKRFIAKAGRGLNIPSISPSTYAQVKHGCGLRYENGFGDVLYGENHRRYYSAFVNYAEQYNLTILRTCR